MTMDVQQLITLLQPLRQQGMNPFQATQSVLSTATPSIRAQGVPGEDLQNSAFIAQALVREFAQITPAELAAILHENYPDLSAVDIGKTILDPRVLPGTPSAVMLSALTSAGFAPDTAADAVNILYPIQYIVQSTQPWQDSGLIVTGRQTTQLTASGSWTASPGGGRVGPTGAPQYIAKPGYAMPGAHEGALVARIGGNPPFLVGNGAQAPAGQSGPLQLCINDDLNGIYGAGLKDNIGTMQVNIVTH